MPGEVDCVQVKATEGAVGPFWQLRAVVKVTTKNMSKVSTILFRMSREQAIDSYILLRLRAGPTPEFRR